MGSLDFLANVMASHHYVTSPEAVARAASIWHGHPPTDRSDITRAFTERPDMFTPDETPSEGAPDAYGVAAVEAGAAVPAHAGRAEALQKVRSLIAVAVGHANDNEARASAVIACKLILEHDLLKSD